MNLLNKLLCKLFGHKWVLKLKDMYCIRCGVSIPKGRYCKIKQGGLYMIDKLKEFKVALLDKDYPIALDEVLGYIEYLFEDDKEVSKVIQSYIDDFYKMWSCVEKFYKIKDLVDEEFYSEMEDEI